MEYGIMLSRVMVNEGGVKWWSDKWCNVKCCSVGI